MIDAVTMVNKLGKKKFNEMVVHSQKNGETGHDKTRGIRGRLKWRTCGKCSKWVVQNFLETPCLCPRVSQTKPKDFRPSFNIGLGYWVESRQEEKRIAKSLGLQEAG